MTTGILRFSAIDALLLDPNQISAEQVVLFFDAQPLEIRLERAEVSAPRSADYLTHREEAWRAKKAKHGSQVWNGRVATLRGLSISGGTLRIQLGECEYKDIVLKQALGLDAVRALDSAPLDVHLFSAVLPITQSGEAILGIVGAGTIQAHGELDLIGGTLNIDEGPISEWDEVRRRTALELKEEANIAVSASDFIPLSLNLHEGSGFFLFQVRVPADSTQRFNENPELAGIARWSYEQLREASSGASAMTTDLEFVLRYVTQLERCFAHVQDS